MTDVIRTVTADRGDAGQRLDLVVRRHLKDATGATRTRIQSWIEEGRVAVNGAVVRRVSTRTMAGDAVSVVLPEAATRAVMSPEDLPLVVLHEDDALLVLDKPPGVVVHPTYRHTTHTIMNALLWRARDWPDGQRPSIVGRLDKQTSGLVLVAKSREMHAVLQRALTQPASEKDYLALVYGAVAPSGTIDLRLGRDPADRRRVVASKTVGSASRTDFERLATAGNAGTQISLLRCRLLTGRTHQIRAHLSAQGWPIVGDATYGEPRLKNAADPEMAGRPEAFPRQALHAWRLSVRHPATGRPLQVQAPLPADMRALLGSIFEATEIAALASLDATHQPLTTNPLPAR